MTSFIGTVLGPGNHVEVGSAIRSTAAFGGGRVFIEDRKPVWFGCDRAIRWEGRAAARRRRNEITSFPIGRMGRLVWDRNEASERIANIQPGDVIFISSKQLSCIDDSEVFLFGGSVTVQSPPHATGKGGSFAQASRSGCLRVMN